MCIRFDEPTTNDDVKVIKDDVDIEEYVIVDEQMGETIEFVYTDSIGQRNNQVEQINMAIGDEFEEEEDKDEFAPPINSADIT